MSRCVAALTATATAAVLLAVPAPTSAAVVSDRAAAAATARAARADAFHTYSGTRAELAKMRRGTVIRTRSLTYSLQGVPVPIRVVQLLHRTTDQLGRPTTNVTSVLRPPVALHPDRVVAYGSFYDSLNPLDGP
ncbi:hypothetical protein [Nocardioides rubriscoriae]|uniref:hypothetical protein n=1 Tax=Nocardioides rubriscoriae TaxID=642762 RepID=UPI001B861589|nr:hypothetical protein [Nocardioides rubriscoriae]